MSKWQNAINFWADRKSNDLNGAGREGWIGGREGTFRAMKLLCYCNVM